MKQIPRSLRNVASNWAGTLVSMLVAFFLSPFVVHHLGATAYGVWVMIMSLTGSLSLLDLGVRGAVTRYIANFHALGKHDEASRLASSALASFTVAGAVAIGASVTAALIALRRFHAPQNHLEVLLILAGASVATTLISSVFGAIVVGLQRFELSNAIEIIAAIAKAGVILFALGHGQGLVALATIQLAFSCFTTVAYALTSWRLYPQLNVRYMLSDKASAHLIFSFGGYAFLLSASSYLVFYTDYLVVGAFLPAAMVTFFAIAGNLVTYSRAVSSGIAFTMSPLASSLEAKGSRRKLERIALSGPRYATMVILPIVVTFMLRGRTFIGLWMGSAYAVRSGSILRILSVALFFSAANQVTTEMMLGINRHRPVALVCVAEGILNLAMSIGLVQMIGIVGVAWGTSIPRLAISLAFWPLYMRRVFGIRFSQYVSSTWIRPAVAAVPFALISFIIDRMWYTPTLLCFFFQVALVLPVAASGFWFVCLSQTDRRSWLAQISSSKVQVGEAA